MTVLIVFESIEGQTAKIVQHVDQMLLGRGLETRHVDTAQRRVDISYQDVTHVILAAPVHERRHPPNFEVFVGSEKSKLAQLKTLMLSVSLKAAFEEGIPEAEDFLQEMEMRTRFEANDRVLVAGAVRRSSYDYFASQVLRHVVLAGQDPALGLKDQEFTDWDALDKKVAAFVTDAAVQTT